MKRYWLAIYGFFLVLFGVLGYLAHRFPTFPGDLPISLWLQKLDLPFFHSKMVVLSFLGGDVPAAIIVTIVVICLWVTRKRPEAIFIAVLASTEAMLNWLLKQWIARPRPTGVEIWSNNTDASFPSGHVVFVAVFYGFLCYLLPKLIKQRAAAVTLQAVSILLIVFTGVSRIYLGAHWLSDALGSLLLAGLLLAPAIVLYHNYRKTGVDHARTA
ncbi:MAG: phosphatase PAP2 family protein [Chloroflexota bacterium]